VKIKLGTISMQMEICLNRKGHITSSRAWTSDDEAGAAATLGWRIQFHGAARNSRSKAYHEWDTSGMARVCGFQIFTCGYEDRFAMTVGFYGAVQGRDTSAASRCGRRAARTRAAS